MPNDRGIECELKYEPGEGFFVRTDDEPERAITVEEIVTRYTEQALLMLDCFPSAWCAIPKLDFTLRPL
jgi:hypothetical protein